MIEDECPGLGLPTRVPLHVRRRVAFRPDFMAVTALPSYENVYHAPDAIPHMVGAQRLVAPGNRWGYFPIKPACINAVTSTTFDARNPHPAERGDTTS